MEADSTRSFAFVKVNGDCFRDLLLQVSEILPLRRDSAVSSGVVPRCHEPPQLLVLLNLESNLIHSQAHYFTRALTPRGAAPQGRECFMGEKITAWPRAPRARLRWEGLLG